MECSGVPNDIPDFKSLRERSTTAQGDAKSQGNNGFAKAHGIYRVIKNYAY
jgi:hypothetical protein